MELDLIPRKVLGVNFKKSKNPWLSFWNLVEAAGKFAEAEWLLFCGPGEGPKAGFLFYKVFNEEHDGEKEDFLYDEIFPGNKLGLKKALRAVEEAKKDENVSEILLEINHRKYLPGDCDLYCRPIVRWLRK
jgi:hypothetical protein